MLLLYNFAAFTYLAHANRICTVSPPTHFSRRHNDRIIDQRVASTELDITRLKIEQFQVQFFKLRSEINCGADIPSH